MSSLVNSLSRFPLKIQFGFAHCIHSTARLVQRFSAPLEAEHVPVQVSLAAGSTSVCTGLGMEQEDKPAAAGLPVGTSGKAAVPCLAGGQRGQGEPVGRESPGPASCRGNRAAVN